VDLAFLGRSYAGENEVMPLMATVAPFSVADRLPSTVAPNVPFKLA
jgi:hypothetical protein